MKTVLIIIQSVMYNRGSEALCRGLSKIIKEAAPDTHIILNSAEDIFPGNLKLPHVDEYVKRLSIKSKWSGKGLIATFLDKVMHNKKEASKIRYKNLLLAAKRSDVIIVFGADNFDNSPEFDFTANSFFYQLLKEQNNAKLIMYDLSMSRENITPSIVEGFNKCDEVTSRDSISINNLICSGIKKVHYFPDPAFVMGKQPCSLPEGWVEGKMMGINLSNLALRKKYGGNKKTVLNSYYKMIDTVLEQTDLNIVLVPHVMNGADLSVLKIIYEKYNASGRVILIDNENLSAPELKYIISNCCCYVGARTHSTIAAYSTYVPTLVVGYSVKSRGIAVDLFGTEEHFVVPVYTIDNEDMLAEEVMCLIEQKDEIKKKMEEVIPGYIEKVYGIRELI